MTRAAWNKLLDLLYSLIMSRCRTKSEADELNAKLEDIRREVYKQDG